MSCRVLVPITEARAACPTIGVSGFRKVLLLVGIVVSACSQSGSYDPPTTSAITVPSTTELDAVVAALSALSADDARLVVPIQHTAGSAYKLRAIIRSTDGLLAYQVDSLEGCSSTAQFFTEEPPYSLPPAVAAIIRELGAQCGALAGGGIGHVITDEERASASSAIAAVNALYEWWKA